MAQVVTEGRMNLDSFHTAEQRIDYLNEQETLIQSFVDRLADDGGRTSEKAWPIYDGINPEKYGRSKYRICWILKEGYEGGGTEHEGGGWGWHDAFMREDHDGNTQTWRPMTYITYSLLHDFQPYASLPKIDKNMARVFQEIAYVNINKMPAGHSSNSVKITQQYEFWKPILLWQIRAYDPQIIIFGNVFWNFADDLGITKDEVKNSNEIDYVVKNHKLYLNVWHPAYLSKGANYEQNIIDMVHNNIKQMNIKSRGEANEEN
jgi:hypothetical protein